MVVLNRILNNLLSSFESGLAVPVIVLSDVGSIFFVMFLEAGVMSAGATNKVQEVI